MLLSSSLAKLPVINRRKVGTTSNHHAPYALGYTRVTMGGTASSKPATASKSLKPILSSDRSLQLDFVKSESLVTADQHAAVNTFPGLGLILAGTTVKAKPSMAGGCGGMEWLRRDSCRASLLEGNNGASVGAAEGQRAQPCQITCNSLLGNALHRTRRVPELW